MADSRDSRASLRLVWSRPTALPRRPPARVNLAHAIERHLSGQDGLTEKEFVVLYATGRRPLALVER
jgi:hypothetical protein